MTPARLIALALGAALAGWIGGAAAQQPLTPQQKLEAQQKKAQAPQPPLTPQQKLEAQQKKQQAANVHYDEYEASRRFPTKRGGCQEGSEQLLGSFCVRTCRAGYVATDNTKSSVRQCRSQKPLPPGQLPVAGQKETSNQPPAKPAAAGRPGV